MFPLDISIVHGLNGYTEMHPLLADGAIFFAVYVPYILVLTLLIFIFYKRKQSGQRGHVALVSVLAALLARYVVKSLILIGHSFSRPYIAFPDISLLIPPILTEEYQSFPSGHMLFFFAMATVLYFYNRKLGLVFLIISSFIGITRVMVGVHYPSDIIAGAIIGVVVGALCSLLNRTIVAVESK